VLKRLRIQLPRDEFFKTLGVKPNYRLCFSDRIQNYHKNLITKERNVGKELTGISFSKEMFEKLNFYSSLEDKFKPVRNKSYIPEMTMLYFEMAHKVAHAVARKRIGRIVSRFEDLIGNLVLEPVSYRKEIRVSPVSIIDACGVIDTDDFIATPVHAVNSIIRYITTRYLDYLQVGDMASLNIRNDLLLWGSVIGIIFLLKF
jgi:hypothetical protein